MPPRVPLIVNAPNRASSNNLLINAGRQISQGVGGIGDALGSFEQGQQAINNRLEQQQRYENSIRTAGTQREFSNRLALENQSRAQGRDALNAQLAQQRINSGARQAELDGYNLQQAQTTEAERPIIQDFQNRLANARTSADQQAIREEIDASNLTGKAGILTNLDNAIGAQIDSQIDSANQGELEQAAYNLQLAREQNRPNPEFNYDETRSPSQVANEFINREDVKRGSFFVGSEGGSSLVNAVAKIADDNNYDPRVVNRALNSVAVEGFNNEFFSADRRVNLDALRQALVRADTEFKNSQAGQGRIRAQELRVNELNAGIAKSKRDARNQLTR